ncbi:4-hydroxy-3-methylbut-2-enyl diphosphate reductase [Aphanizomenon flos-aquae NRERC-008]|jgi:4-hydroxy-3-methylbut-2-enyl diphosphate reductase|uniref:4-hydroxy-3-methylbut-2-enyl diphosphate reductase n=1 Tax=Aphanizomenon flos-aquae FACHB-1249 TaxID=2692889 RepID=A0ABR8IQI1_APHFL|nr:MULTISPECIES: 4-hydroxy-3-methylbut-2-enyl diphosphate reductase [Aphanizomenon]MCE2904752.1 4-hydroxy-3-methylbut-2-enyl diphosphate reductase [Anabaena sp. CoA2_C59]MDJ0505804.1 4-hydroxy-3-methylbut-2-enyl diphosphate reductase [Nostocales cyanobacterium LE14-WE12]MBD2631074.1 4-hydroxy-3-methylbut-2-enyl diphosphate reductase [Aphanizomenon sp. FACHB-1399]MBD2644289.1 4-hydroxy-3-methylbut-2-enyl diphosphate reductase [Aphanizomenon sp. FACHB-1401]MBD2674497.1 4-hydroxy-3-methylbut-2-en
MDTKAFKRGLQHSANYNRKGFGHQAEVATQLQSEYQSNLIQEIRDSNYTLKRGDVTIQLAQAFGFCWGVERAVAMAYETRQHFPTEQIWITNEIIHNPSVNKRMQEMQVEFIPVIDKVKDFSVVGSGDVVILPAFGASVQEMQILNDKGCQMVDTTCPWVSKVWNTVEKHKKGDYTSIIHGKYKHEETVATISFAGKYLIVLNLKEAEYVINYILNGGNREEFLTKFAKACSQGFDPDQDLERVGIANQTTMLKGETEQIGKMLERAMMQKYGPTELNQHFQNFNTICDATQERQDAMLELVEDNLDLMIVIGGFNSSNTTQLQQIAIDRGIPSYHIDCVQRIQSINHIEHRQLTGELIITENWLPAGEIKVGVTSGASTPDKVVEDIIEQIFALKATAT